MNSKNRRKSKRIKNPVEVPWEYPSESEVAKAESAARTSGELPPQTHSEKTTANFGCLPIVLVLIAFGLATYFIGLESSTAARWFFLIGTVIGVLVVLYAIAQTTDGFAIIFMIILFLGVSSLFSTCTTLTANAGS